MRLVKEKKDFVHVINKLYMGKIHFANRYYYRDVNLTIVRKNTYMGRYYL